MTANRETSEPVLFLVGIVLGMVISTGPATCAASSARCEGYAAGSGQACVRADGECVCAEALTPAEADP